MCVGLSAYLCLMGMGSTASPDCVWLIAWYLSLAAMLLNFAAKLNISRLPFILFSALFVAWMNLLLDNISGQQLSILIVIILREYAAYVPDSLFVLEGILFGLMLAVLVRRGQGGAHDGPNSFRRGTR